MTTRRLIVLLGCFFLAGCAGKQAGGGADQDALQGTWRVERAELGGKVSDESGFRETTITFDGDKVVTEISGVRHEGNFSLDAYRMPHQIDFKPVPGNNTDKQLQGVYALESTNNLRLCFSQKSRPSGVYTSSNSDAILFELKRVPPREAAEKKTASELVEKCRSNKIFVADTFRGMVFQVNGTVTENKDGHVHLAASKGDYVECQFNRNYKSELERLTQIRESQAVTLRGTFSAVFDTKTRGTYVQLVNCEVVEVGPEGKAP